MLSALSQYLCSAMTLHRIHHGLLLSGKWPMDCLCSHFGRRSFQVYLFVLRNFPIFMYNTVFVTVNSHCWQACRGHLAPLIHMEPPAASSPASRKLHQEGLTNVKVHTVPYRSHPLLHGTKQPQADTMPGFPH